MNRVLASLVAAVVVPGSPVFGQGPRFRDAADRPSTYDFRSPQNETNRSGSAGDLRAHLQSTRLPANASAAIQKIENRNGTNVFIGRSPVSVNQRQDGTAEVTVVASPGLLKKVDRDDIAAAVKSDLQKTAPNATIEVHVVSVDENKQIGIGKPNLTSAQIADNRTVRSALSGQGFASQDIKAFRVETPAGDAGAGPKVYVAVEGSSLQQRTTLTNEIQQSFTAVGRTAEVTVVNAATDQLTAGGSDPTAIAALAGVEKDVGLNPALVGRVDVSRVGNDVNVTISVPEEADRAQVKAAATKAVLAMPENQGRAVTVTVEAHSAADAKAVANRPEARAGLIAGAVRAELNNQSYSGGIRAIKVTEPANGRSVTVSVILNQPLQGTTPGRVAAHIAEQVGNLPGVGTANIVITDQQTASRLVGVANDGSMTPRAEATLKIFMALSDHGIAPSQAAVNVMAGTRGTPTKVEVTISPEASQTMNNVREVVQAVADVRVQGITVTREVSVTDPRGLLDLSFKFGTSGQLLNR